MMPLTTRAVSSASASGTSNNSSSWTCRSMRAASPAPYHFYLRLGGRELFGASPELLVEVAEGKMTVRPIAGTRRRGATIEEDLRLEQELRADQKERAFWVATVTGNETAAPEQLIRSVIAHAA